MIKRQKLLESNKKTIDIDEIKHFIIKDECKQNREFTKNKYNQIYST